MKKRNALLVAGFVAILLLPVSVSAQASVQNNVNNNLQQQQSNAQATGNPLGSQTNTIQQNNSTEALSKVQQESLGVVSSPSQTKPDVTVGAAQTTDKSTVPSKNNNAIWGVLALAAVAIIVGFFWVNRRQPAENTAATVVSAKSDSPEVSKEEIAKKPKKKPTEAQKKKKKKRAHR